MLRIKRLNTFMLQTYLPQFCMTFFICLFILMMQFLFRYINDLVGKGLAIDVLGELFFYAALSMIPMALPLAILLASLMTFGNLGEHVELTALKSAGISLIRVMRPLIIFIILVAVGAFFFQNDVLPKTQVKMWTLLFSARQKSLSLDITEGTINSQIPGYNVYVKHKDKKSGMLHDVLIYDVSSGASYPRIVAADSGMLSMTPDEKHIQLKLYHGNWYEELRQGGGGEFGSDMYRRESFHDKDILIPYDATFTRMDDGAMKSQYIGKNMSELQHTIDSIQGHVDSLGTVIGREMKRLPVCGVQSYRTVQSGDKFSVELVSEVKPRRAVNVDSFLLSFEGDQQSMLLTQSVNSATSAMQNAQFRAFSIAGDNEQIRRHEIELQKKFTLSLACLIFFFIGAPLGAIIRKGGLGTPIVISVLLFIVYYIIDNTGYKMARDGHWQVWEGIWLSSAVLLPLGIFFTYKAVNDSAVFNPDAYRNVLRRLMNRHQTRNLVLKEVVVNEVERDVAVSRLEILREKCRELLDGDFAKTPSLIDYLLHNDYNVKCSELSDMIEHEVDYLSNSRQRLVVNKAMDYPIVQKSIVSSICDLPYLGWLFIVVFPLGVALGYYRVKQYKELRNDIKITIKVSDHLVSIFNGTDDCHQAH